MRHRRETVNGFTLIEMLITVAIIAVILGLAVPSFNDFFNKNRLKQATEQTYGLIAQAKAEAVTRDADIIVTVNSAAWCIGYAVAIAGGAACNCTLIDPEAAGACAVPVAGVNVLKVVDGADFIGVNIADNFGGGSTFDSIRGTANNGTINFTVGNWALDVVVSTRGRIRACAPDAKTMGYNAC